MLNAELDRWKFIANRDGMEAADAWELRTETIYRNASLAAKDERWATIYCRSARVCGEIGSTPFQR